MYDVVLLTEKKYINPTDVDWYVEQVLQEDGLVKDALEAEGLKCTIKAWCDSDFDWASTKTVLFRTIWDYFHRFDEFSKWLEETKHKTKMINPYAQIKWNVDKHYLGDLEQKGINIVKSHFIEKGDSKNLADWHQELGWSETVLKPCVSGGGRHTYRLNPDNYAEHEAVFKELIQDEAMMLQPFMKNVPTKGEVSHIVIGGQYSHSILKIAKKGDYRVQDDFGGSVHDYTANEQEIKYAESVAKACEPLPYYARVDVIWDDNDELALGEVELIEPELWFRNFPEAAKMLAREITSREFSV